MTYQIPTAKSVVPDKLIHDAGILYWASELFPHLTYNASVLMTMDEYLNKKPVECCPMSVIVASGISSIGSPGNKAPVAKFQCVSASGREIETEFVGHYLTSEGWVTRTFSKPVKGGFKGVAALMLILADYAMGLIGQAQRESLEAKVAATGISDSAIEVLFDKVPGLATYRTLLAQTKPPAEAMAALKDDRKIYPGHIEIEVGKAKTEVTTTVEVDVIRWPEEDRDYVVCVGEARHMQAFIESAEEEVNDGVASHEFNTTLPDAVLIVHGCRRFSTFEQAFRHFAPTRYMSDGNLPKIREAYRRLQTDAIKRGWIVNRAPNTYAEM